MKKTPTCPPEPWRRRNTERRTPNTEFSETVLFFRESPNSDYPKANGKKYDLEDRLLDFAVDVVEFTENLPNTRAANYIAGQLLRSGTSPYGNHGELESAESRKDFIHKLKVCLKELPETRRWLRLLGRLKKTEAPATLPASLNEAEELIRIFAASIRTAERNNA